MDDEDRSPPRGTRQEALDPEQQREFEQLLQGQDAWWYFLEAKAYSQETRQVTTTVTGDGQTVIETTREVTFSKSSSDEEPLPEIALVGRMAERARRENEPTFQTHFTDRLHCPSCHAMIPADLTFCVYCGSTPKYSGHHRAQLLIVEGIGDPDIFEEMRELVTHSNRSLDQEELRSALDAPPAVFYFYGQDEHARALVDRLGEIGVRARATNPEGEETTLAREWVEAIARSPQQVGYWILLLMLGVGLGVMLSPWFLVLMVVVGMILFYKQAVLYRSRYEIDAVMILNALTGMSEASVSQARRVLGALPEGDAMRRMLTICMMEYYAIWRHLAASEPAMRRLLEPIRENLSGLLEQILDACQRYAQLQEFVQSSSSKRIRAQVEELEALEERSTIQERTLEQRRKQLENVETIERELPRFREYLELLGTSMESLRSRVVALTMSGANVDQSERELSVILEQLDDEVVVFEQTMDALQTVIHE